MSEEIYKNAIKKASKDTNDKIKEADRKAKEKLEADRKAEKELEAELGAYCMRHTVTDGHWHSISRVKL